MPQVVVIGAGVFGTWTAHHLRAAGSDVTLIDAYGPANPRASSSDQSRILRCGYGADEVYSDFMELLFMGSRNEKEALLEYSERDPERLEQIMSLPFS